MSKSFRMVLGVIAMVALFLVLPITVVNDGRDGFNPRLLPIAYGLVDEDWIKVHRDEFWPGGCVVREGAPKWAIVF